MPTMRSEWSCLWNGPVTEYMSCSFTGFGGADAGTKIVHERGRRGVAVSWRGCVCAPCSAALLGSRCKAGTTWSVYHPSAFTFINPVLSTSSGLLYSLQ